MEYLGFTSTMQKTRSQFKDFCIHIFSHVRPNATLLSVREYRNNWHEVSNLSVCFHASYLNAVRRAKVIIEKFATTDSVLVEAQAELLSSFGMTLAGNNPLYTCAGVYEDIPGADGKPIPGIKLHINQDLVHINAMKIRKKVLTPGIYPDTQSSQKTIAKRFLRSKTPLAHWVQFKLEPLRFSELAVQKMRIKGK